METNLIVAYNAPKTEVIGSLCSNPKSPIFSAEGTLYTLVGNISISSTQCSSIEDVKESYLQAMKKSATFLPDGEYAADMVISENDEYCDSDELVVFRVDNDVIVSVE